MTAKIDQDQERAEPEPVEGELSTLSDFAFDRIIELILDGVLPPGSVVNEAEIAKQFGMSRGPVREAIRRLQGQKLITREAFQRARVVKLGVLEMVEIFQLREALEAMSCRLATQTMSDEQLDYALATLDPSSENPIPEDFDFHIILAQHCGNRRIADLLCNELYYLLRLYRKRSGTEPGRAAKARREHWQIARAMRSRDAELAESLMRAHISSVTERLQQSLEA